MPKYLHQSKIFEGQNIYIKPSFQTAYVGEKSKNWVISKVAQKFAKPIGDFFRKNNLL